MKNNYTNYIFPPFKTGSVLGIAFLFSLNLFLLNSSYATISVPVADFSADKTTIFAGDSIQLTDLSTNTPTSWSWTLTGASPALSTIQNPKVLYPNPGTYNITLTSSNSGGASTPVTKTGYITVNDASVGNDNAALVDVVGPRLVDPGTYDVQVKLRNMGENLIYALTVNWELNGVLQTPFSWTSTLDTINGVTSSRDAIITLGSVTLMDDSVVSLKAWTSGPNSGIDPQPSNDTIRFNLRSKLSGTYTIGGTNPDFPTINSAIDGLKNTYGINGPVTFNIRNGVYTENINIGNIPGTSSTNTLLFKSENNNASLVSIIYAPTSAVNNWTVKVLNTNYVTFKDLSITSTDPVNARALVIEGSTSFLTVERCNIATVPSTGSTNVISAVYGASLTGSDIRFKHNAISGGSYGMYLAGTSTTTLLGANVVIDSNDFSGAGYNSVYLFYVNAPKFRNNTMDLSPPTYSSIYGAYFGYCDNGLEISGNKIIGTSQTAAMYGLYIYYCDGTAANYAKIYNNEMVFGTSGTLYGLQSYYSSFAQYYNNSVLSSSTGTTNYATYFYHSAATSSDIIIRNNIFANTGGGYAMYNYNPAFTNSDYNLFYSTSPTNLIYKGLSTAVAYGTLNAYQAAFPGQETHSIVYRPAFMSSTNLKPNPADTACWLMNGTGVHTTLDKDMLGNTRPIVALDGAPDMGAYQFTPASTPPRATAVPDIAVMGQSQAFLYGNDTVAVIDWDLSTPVAPTYISVQNYLDSTFIPSGPELQLRSFLRLNIVPAGGSYTYNLKYFYKTPLIGNIVNEENLIGSKYANSAWTHFYSGTTELDTLNNTFKINFLGNPSVVVVGTDNFTPLPVKLISLSAKADNKNVLLDWTTASESNNRGFEIERSANGRDFKYVNFVGGAKNSKSLLNYSYTDAKAFDATGSSTVYYRLKQIDADGKSAYSNIVRVNANAMQTYALSLSPNPYSTDYTVSFAAANPGNASVEMLDIQGKIVASQNASVTEGVNNISMDEAAGIKAGVYFVRVTVNGETQILKLVKN